MRKKLTKRDVEKIDRYARMGMADQEIGRLYGIDERAICDIKIGAVATEITGRRPEHSGQRPECPWWLEPIWPEPDMPDE